MMNKTEETINYYHVAKFLGKALHGIATGKEFTVQDAKDATDAISAVGQLGMLKMGEKEAIELIRILAEATKSTLDVMVPAKLGGWEDRITVPSNFNDPLDGFEGAV